MSQPALYALNVITLAAWLSVSLGAMIGFSVPQEWSVALVLKPQPLSVMTSIDIAPAEALQDAQSEENQTSENTEVAEPTVVPVMATLPTPPPMPEMAPMEDLPDVPEILAPVIKKTAVQVAAPSTTRPQAKPSSSASANNRPATTGKSAGGGPPSNATTLSFGSGAGRQPAPSYPLQARRSNHQGTVLVEFIVGVDGKVLSAWVKTPCAYDSLNNAALSTIRSRWKFPAGEARRYKIPIVFRLN
jgi:protein TonB